MRSRFFICATVAAGAALLLWGQANVPNIFYTDVPEHAWDVVLARPTTTSITASLLAYRDLEGYFEIGAEAGSYTTQTPTVQFPKGSPVETVIDSLAADTQYFYRFQSREPGTEEFTAGPEFSFHTQRPPGASFTVTVQADSHLDFNTDPAIYAQTLVNALADGPDFHIDLGDTFMNDKYPAYKDSFNQYIAQRYYFGLLCHSAPLFITLGNHDGEQGRYLNGSDENMTVWSNTMRKRYFPNPVPDGFYTGNDTPDKVAGLTQSYFAWEWGDALFVVLDPYWYTQQRGPGSDNWAWTLGATQYRWLAATLRASRAQHKMIFIHQLVGGADSSQRGGSEAARIFEWGGNNPDGTEGFKKNRPGWEMPIHQLLVETGVGIVFHGHDHLYVKQDLDGIVYHEVPQPGQPNYNATNSAAEYGYRSGTLMSSPGHLRIGVSPEQVKVEYVRPYLPKAETATRHNRDIGHSYVVKPR
jgi:hypothetical protein